MMVIKYCIASIIFWTIFLFTVGKKKKDYLYILTVLLLVYLLNYQIKMLASKYGIYLIDSNQFGEIYQLAALVLSDFSMIIIIATFWCTSKIRDKRPVILSVKNYSFVKANIFFLAIFIFSGLVANGKESLYRMFAYSSMVEFRKYRGANRLGSGRVGLFSIIMVLCLLSIIYVSVNNTKKLKINHKMFLGMEIALCTWYMYANTMSKTSLLLPITAFLLSMHMHQVKKGKKGITLKILAGFGGAGAVLISVLEYVDIVKEQAAVSLKEMTWDLLCSFFNPSFDVPDNLTAILYRMNDIFIGDLRLRPFMYNLFASKIPRAIWTSKYAGDGKQMVVENFLPEFYDGVSSSAASPSIVGDALVSGGILLAIILSVVYGTIFFKMYKKAYTTNDLLSNVMYLYLMVSLNDFCRGGSGILGNLILYYVLMFFLSFGYKQFNKINC